MFEDDDVININDIIKNKQIKFPEIEIDFNPRVKPTPVQPKEEYYSSDAFMPEVEHNTNFINLFPIGLFFGFVSLFFNWTKINGASYSFFSLPSCWIFVIPFVLCLYEMGRKRGSLRNYSMLVVLIFLGLLLFRIGSLWGIGYFMCVTSYIIISLGYGYQKETN